MSRTSQIETALGNITIETWNQPDMARINRFLGRKENEVDFADFDEEADEEPVAA